MKQINYKKLAKIFSILILCFVFMFNASISFAGFGISPSDILKDNLKPGSEFEKKFILSRSDPDEDLVAIVETNLGEAEPWFTFIPGRRFILPKGEQRVEMRVKVKVPEDAALTTYDGSIVIKVKTPGEQLGGVSVIKGATMQVELLTTELDMSELLVRQMKFIDHPADEDLELVMKIENTGNTAAAPSKVSTDIFDINDNQITTLESIDEIEKINPYETKEVSARIPHNLEKGEYFADTQVYVDSDVIKKEKIFFRVLDGTPQDLEENQGQTKEESKKIFSIKANFMVILVLLIILTILNLVLLIVKTQKMKDKKKKLNKTIIILSITSILSLSASIYMLTLAITEKTEQTSSPAITEETTDSTENKETAEQEESQTNENGENAEVKGSFTIYDEKNKDKEEEEVAEPFQVRYSDEEALYPIFESADIKSEIIHFAKEDDDFEILDELAEWYHIRINDQNSGYLPKDSVKNIQ